MTLSEVVSIPPATLANLVPSPSATRESSPLSSTTSFQRDSSQDPHAIAGTPQSSRLSKKPKLTSAEKVVANAEKERKTAERILEKSLKEEEKRLRDVERKVKEEAREEKRRQRDLEKATKEEEKRLKEVEKAKKEKAQLRLSAFFVKPPISSHGSATSSRRNSIASDHGSIIAEKDEQAQESLASEFDRAFPPFFVKQHTSMASGKVASLDIEVLEWNATDESRRSTRKRKASALEELVSRKSKRKSIPRAVKDIISDLRGSFANPVDLTQQDPLPNDLSRISVKYLRFAEDVRPPYYGTFSRIPNPHMATRLRRNPFTRAFDSLNYDYDSEAEWEEPEEGEDLDSDGEEEAGDDDEADEMEDFLEDDEPDAVVLKRRQVMSDLTPICTGLLWDSDTRNSPSTFDMRPFRMETLHADLDFPIDPYSTKVWQSSLPSAPTIILMPPPRHPLLPSQTTGNILPDLIVNLGGKVADPQAPITTSTTKSKVSTAAKPIPPELLVDFKKAVQGSDLTKTGLIEVLKKRFPQITKVTVQDTLASIAMRVGKKESEKVWVLL